MGQLGFRKNARSMPRALLLVLAALGIALTLGFVQGAGAAGSPGVTFTSTQTLPVPPASNYAGQGGGDGWGIALRPEVDAQHPSTEYNVFHHDTELVVACHLQSNAQACWSPVAVSDPNGATFTSTSEPGVYLDQTTYKLYVWSTRSQVVNDRTVTTAGVVCFDTLAADTDGTPFCGFTPLSADGDGTNANGWSTVSDPVLVGTRWFAFNDANGVGVVGTKNTLMCFDTKNLSACAGQPFTVNLGLGDNNASVNQPPPPIAAVGNDVFVPINGASDGSKIGCFDGAQLTNCSGWPVTDTSGLVGNIGAPVPMLTPKGQPNGVCLPSDPMPCWDLSGASVTAPDALRAAIADPGESTWWNGPATQIGPRIYVPKWNSQVNCYDFFNGKGCDGYPRVFSGADLLYTVNPDPQRPTCLWINSNDGDSQIQNFDAFDPTKPCDNGTIRLPGSFFVVDTPECTPGSYTSLQVTDPPRSAYVDGSLTFADTSGNPLSAEPLAIDSTGTVSLAGINLNTDAGLPQFLLTLNRGDSAAPTSVTLKLTWTGNFDPACSDKGGTTVVNPPTTTPPPANPTPPPPPPPAQSNVALSLAGPADGRVGKGATFTATIKNTGQDPAQGVELTAPAPPGATLTSATPSQGTCLAGSAHCVLGTLGPGASATVTILVTPTAAGTLTVSGHVSGDHDTNAADDNSSASTTVVDQGAPPPAPPAPTTPGTVNAISTGTVFVNGIAVAPDTVFLIKAGDVVQLNGFLTFTTIGGSVGTFSNVPFTGSRRLTSSSALLRAAVDGPTSYFTIGAPTDASGQTVLTLTNGDFNTCSAPRKLSANKPKATVVRQLWGHAKGNFRTTAKYSSATIRGTTWGVQDRCDGTLTTALDDPVDVFDNTLGKTVTITGGQTYLAKPSAPFTPPAPTVVLPKAPPGQTVATVRSKGLRWAGRTFRTRAALTRFLKAGHSSWAAFARVNPAAAAALTKASRHKAPRPKARSRR